MPKQEVVLVGGGRTGKIINPTGAGSITKGAKRLYFKNIGASDATVAGGTLPAGEFIELPQIPGDVYREIAYDPQSSTLLIVETR